AQCELAPAPLQPDERFPAAQVTGVGVAVDRRFDLANRIETAAQALGTTYAQARRVAAEAIDRWVRAIGLLAVDEFEVDIQATVQCDVRGLRLRSQRQRKPAGDGKSDELFIHGVSPLTE